MIELNLTPAFLLAREAMPRLVERGGGAFVGVSARAALRPFAGAAGYIAGKAALLAFVQALDAEYKDQGVRANAILPSVIDTPANRAAQPDADYSKWVDPRRSPRWCASWCRTSRRRVSGAAVPVYGRACVVRERALPELLRGARRSAARRSARRSAGMSRPA